MVTSLGAAVSLLEQNPVFGVTITLGAYEIGSWIQRHCGGSPLANPVLISITLIVAGLELAGISYDTYLRGGGLVRFLLGPATVALALPIYLNADRIRGAALGIFAGVTVGATVACASAVGIAWLMGAPDDLLRSIAPKSVTTPIAIGISEQINGHPSLTSVLVITSGIIGAMLSGRLYDWIGVRDWEVRGLATGIAAHGIGTAQMLSVNETAGAFAGLAIGLTGLFTATLLPIVIHLL
jgi:predicted murein hydrolase (TIGR00659 family)